MPAAEQQPGRTPSVAPAVAAALSQASADYQHYLETETADLARTTRTFTNAVRAGDLAASRAAYPTARVYYERIEPVAESFGALDPDIDARADDPHPSGQWSGFHRIERALYADHSLTGMTPVADRLDSDVAKLRALAAATTSSAVHIADGANELLEEVGTSKVTGEEERYSHLDLVDFQANIDGAREAFDVTKPALRLLSPGLVQEVTTGFQAVDGVLAPYRTGTGPTDFRPFTAVPLAQIKQFSASLNALAEPLSRVGGTLNVG